MALQQKRVRKEAFRPMTRHLLALSLLLFASAAVAADSRTFDVTYTATLADVPAGIPQLNVWIPLPVTRGWQRVSGVHVDAPAPVSLRSENEFGNDYAFTTIENPPAGDLTFKVHFTVTRREATAASPAEKKATYSEIRRALRADKLVTLSPRIRKLADEVTAGKTGVMDQARAIYDYVLLTMKYDKTIPGWGQGDTERACDIKAGNCTDFHSLFISLARAKGIPARFVIGFPLKAADGNVKGYHCWAEFYVKGKGWIPVDASDAWNSHDPAMQAFLFGNLDATRVQFTVGRDLQLSPRTATPLNYFIYPRAEANGKVVGTPSVSVQFQETRQQAAR